MEISGIKEMVEKFFVENAMDNCYFVDSRNQGKKVEVFVDRDGGISFDVCHKLSRYLESFFDEDKRFGEDYILEVSSPGVGSALKLPRQYKNNLGRNIVVKTAAGKLEGVLKDANDESCSVETTETVKVEGKKKKEIVNHKVQYVDIVEAKIKISF